MGVVGLGVALFLRRRKRREWREKLETVVAEVEWFAHDFLVRLRHAGTLEQVIGAWQVGEPRVAAAEDELTALEASAPSDDDRTRARTLRDAVRLARQRLQSLTQPGPHDTWALDIDDVVAGLEVALGPAPPPSE